MPVAVAKGGSTYHLTYDEVGSLRVVADSTGNVVKRIDSDSFGNIINDSDPSFTVPFGFAGGLHDRDTGLVRFGFRDYDPDVGRWLARDPVGFWGGDVDLHGYCLSDPVNLVDPEGDDVGLHFGTQKSFVEAVNKSNLPDWAKHKLEKPAETIDACIHHKIRSKIKGDLLITGDVDVEKDPLRVTGGCIELKYSW